MSVSRSIFSGLEDNENEAIDFKVFLLSYVLLISQRMPSQKYELL